MPRIRAPRPLRPGAHLACLGAALLLAACGAGGGGGGGAVLPGCTNGGGPTVTITGQVAYTRLVLSGAGLGPATEMRPARHVDVEVHASGGGTCYGRASTDATGHYALVVSPPAGSQVEISAYSRTIADATRDLIVHRANPPSFDTHDETNAFSWTSAPFAAATTTVDLDVPYDSVAWRPSIGFGVLDTLLTCWDQADAALGGALPRCHAYTQVGNNGVIGTSYYNPATFSIAILGGAAGLPDGTDTDYFDDAVVAHEFGHFVERTSSHSITRGGQHGGALLEPGFAWSEGQATGFGNLLLGTPYYRDTSSTSGGLFIEWDVENVTSRDNDTIADEATVAELIWDLGDGGAGPVDSDGDGVSVPLADLYAALASFDPASDAPCLGLFLERVVALSASVDSAAMGALLAGPPEDQQISWPLAGSDAWPPQLTVGGGPWVGVVDSRGDSGDPYCRELASSQWFQITLATSQVVTFDLTISPIGGSGDDLNLYLTPNSDVGFPLASSTNAGSNPESIQISLAAGTYLLRVETCGDNRAGYTLTVN